MANLSALRVPLIWLEQVHFALSAAEVFMWSNTEVDSLGFYKSILDFLDDPEEEEEVNSLVHFWN